MSINTVLFDFDGTLMNTNHLIIESFQHTYRSLIGREKDDAHIIKSFGEPMYETMTREFGQGAEEALRIYRAYQFENFEALIDLYEGMAETIKKLKMDGKKLGIVTSRMKNSTLRGLRKYDLEKYFDCVIAADDTIKHKPEPEPIFMALDLLKSGKNESIMIGDSKYDIQCAKNAGVKSVAVAWSAIPKEVYMSYEPEFVIEDIRDIFDII